MKTFFISKILNTQVSNAVLRFLLLTFITHRSAPARKHHYTLLLFFLLLLGGQKVMGQIYRATAFSTTFEYYDISTNSWTPKASIPVTFSLGGDLVFDGTHIYAFVGNNSTAFYKYTINTDTWSSLANNPQGESFNGASLVYDGEFIYAFSGNTTDFNKYDIVNNTWTSLDPSPQNVMVGAALVYDCNNIYGLTGFNNGNQSKKFNKFSISDGIWTPDIAPFPAPAYSDNSGSMTFDGKFIYATPNGNEGLYRFDTNTNTWTYMSHSLKYPWYQNSLVTDGTYLYMTTSNNNTINDLEKYNPNTNTWSLLNSTPNVGSVKYGTKMVSTVIPNCPAPSANITSNAASCSGGIANSDASILLTSISGGATKVDYTIGSSYTGIGFNSVSASVIGVLPHTVVNTLPNPIVNQPYTIRIFKDASTFSDISVLMPPKQCTTADLSVSVTVSPQTGNQGEILVYTITVTNNGPDTDPAVFVKIPIPNNVTYMSSTATQGSYNDLTKNWDVGSVANGVSKILTLSLKVN